MFYLEYANEKITCPDIDGFYPASVTPTVKWYQVRSTFVIIWAVEGFGVVSEKAMCEVKTTQLYFRVCPVIKLLKLVKLQTELCFQMSSRVKLSLDKSTN